MLTGGQDSWVLTGGQDSWVLTDTHQYPRTSESFRWTLLHVADYAYSVFWYAHRYIDMYTSRFKHCRTRVCSCAELSFGPPGNGDMLFRLNAICYMLNVVCYILATICHMIYAYFFTWSPVARACNRWPSTYCVLYDMWPRCTRLATPFSSILHRRRLSSM